MCELMGEKDGVNACVEVKRDVKASTPIYDLSPREDKHLIFKLRKIYSKYREATKLNGYNLE
tara:strand:+ start:611 stop:796 length:186 start_codon:yes stop_codon:yes gene_type:complete